MYLASGSTRRCAHRILQYLHRAAAASSAACVPARAASTSARAASSAASASPLAPPVLVRDFIANALYHPDSGYFCSPSREVIAHPATYINFTSLLGRSEWTHVQAQLYEASAYGWLTPVELFQPHFSNALGRYILDDYMKRRAAVSGSGSAPPLVIYEMGGGLGTNASHLLAYLQAAAPAIYKDALEYRILEISPTLHAKQTTLLERHAAGRPSRAASLCVDATRVAEAGLSDPRPCYVIGMEVLDNLVHDKAVLFESGAAAVAASAGEGLPPEATKRLGAMAGPVWCQTQVASSAAAAAGDGKAVYREVFLPLSDPLVAETLPYYASPDPETAASDAKKAGSSDSLAGRLASKVAVALGRAPRPPPTPSGVLCGHYLPTGAQRLAKSLQAAFPAHSLLLADFSFLPPPVLRPAALRDDHPVDCYVPGHRAPLVASKDPTTRRTVDHPTYMSPLGGTADIFFPTDFQALAKQVADVRRGGEAKGPANTAASSTPAVMQSRDFLSRYAAVASTRTLSGYNPLLEDYTNTAFLVG